MAGRGVLVVGAGFVGVSVALHLRLRGHDVLLVDKCGPGQGTSFGNAGIIQREAVAPHPFPRELRRILGVAGRRRADITYHPDALPRAAGALARYWWQSAPARHRRATAAYASLITHCLEEHDRQVALAGAGALIGREGWLDAYRTEPAFAARVAAAEANARDFGVESRILDGAALAALEPAVTEPMVGAVHWQNSWTVRDPAALSGAYAAAFEERGGEIARGEVRNLVAAGGGWQAELAGGGRLEAAQAVLATGPWAAAMTRRLGYRLPLFVKRGYHMHYAPDPERPLRHWVSDLETGYLLAPMRAGIRLTTGAELARQEAPATPVQLARSETVARRFAALGPQIDPAPWLGSRPCTADMLPVIGPAPRHTGLWFAFGHGHQGLTLGPVTGRLVAEMIGGETPFVDPRPFSPARFR